MSFLDDMKKLAKQTEQQQKAIKQQEVNNRRLELLTSMSNQCNEWATNLKSKIEQSASGKSNNLDLIRKNNNLGSIIYDFRDKKGNLLKVPPLYLDIGIYNITQHDIENTDGFKNLKQICEELCVSFKLTYTDTNYWYIIVSGWHYSGKSLHK